MNDNIPECPTPEECAKKIFEMSGAKFEPEIAADLWAKVEQHKWLLSEKLSRDVGFRTACIDFLENMEQAVNEYLSYKRRDILSEMGAQTFEREIWDTISNSQPPKQLVNRRIILPLIKGTILVAALLRAMEAFRVFPKIYVMTGGGPGRATEASSILIYKTAFRFFEIGYASAMTIIMLVLLVTAYGFYLKVVRKVSVEY